MTPDQWETSADALDMLRAVRGRWRDQAVLHRRLQRYYLACCRAIWPLLPQEASRRGVELAERSLDGKASDEDMSGLSWHVEGAAFNIDYDCDPEAIAGWVRAVEALPPTELTALVHTAEGRSLGARELLLRAAYFTD